LDQKDKEASSYLGNLMDELESDKIRVNPPMDKESGKQIVLEFAESLFDRADGQERQNIATKSVILQFLTSSHLMDVTTEFGPLDEETLQKQKYAKYKAALMSRALKSGEPYKSENQSEGPNLDDGGMKLDSLPPVVPVPVHPPPIPNAGPTSLPSHFTPSTPLIGQQQQQQQQQQNSDLGGFQQGIQQQSPQQQHQSTNGFNPPSTSGHYVPTLNPPPPPAPPSLSSYGPPNVLVGGPKQTASNGYQPSTEAQLHAMKFTKFAVSSLNFCDVTSAVQCLRKSIDLLEGRMGPPN